MDAIPLENSVTRFRDPPDHLSKRERLAILQHNPATMSIICQQIAEGTSLKEIADGERVSYGLLQMWICGDKVRMEAYRNAEKMLADTLIHQAIKKCDDDVMRDKDGQVLKDDRGVPIEKSAVWARLQVNTRLKAAQMLDSERFVQAVKTEQAPLSDSGVAAVARHLAGAFAKRNLPSSEPHEPQDIEAEVSRQEG